MKMFIDGKRVEASDGGTIDVFNSATHEFVDTIPAATEEDVLKAIEAALHGKKVWGVLSTQERSEILFRCAEEIDKNREELARSLSTEMGKIISEARPEIRVAAQILRGFAEEANHRYGRTLTDYQVGTKNDIIFTRHQPLGVVACISPFNYPVELCFQKVSAALAAGNAVLIKPATDNPLTIMKIVEICWKCGVPGDVLQLVTGSGEKIGDVISSNPDIDAISLTGSTEVGLHVAEQASKTLKRVFLELGGNDPFLVFEDADMELAIMEAVKGRIQNAGQTCCSPKRFLVQNSVREAFIKGAAEKMSKIVKGNPLDDKTEFGCVISEKAAKEVQHQVDLTISQGAKLVCGGHLYDKTYFEPTILDDVTETMDIATNMECFGPVMPVMGFDTEEEAIRLANNTRYGLQSGVMTKDMKRAMRVAGQLACGGVVINGSGNYRHLDQPFGGWKMSGLGREGVSVTLDEMTQEKSYIMKNVLA